MGRAWQATGNGGGQRNLGTQKPAINPGLFISKAGAVLMLWIRRWDSLRSAVVNAVAHAAGRALAGPRALVDAYRARAATEGLSDVGLHQAAAKRLFADLGVEFTKMQLQADVRRNHTTKGNRALFPLA